MFCTNCGKEIEDGSVFCTHCGTKQAEMESGINDVSKAEPTEEASDNAESQINEVTVSNSEILPSDVSAAGQATTVSVSGSNEVKPSEPVKTNFSAPLNSDKKKSKSSVVVIGIIAVAVIFALFLLFGKGGGYKDYKDLVQDYYNAIYKEDFKALLKCYDKEDQKDLKDDKKDVEEELESLKESLDDRYDRGWNKKIGKMARAKVDSEDGVTFYTVSVEIDDEAGEVLFIKKYKDRYYIDSENDSF